MLLPPLFVTAQHRTLGPIAIPRALCESDATGLRRFPRNATPAVGAAILPRDIFLHVRNHRRAIDDFPVVVPRRLALSLTHSHSLTRTHYADYAIPAFLADPYHARNIQVCGAVMKMLC